MSSWKIDRFPSRGWVPRLHVQTSADGREARPAARLRISGGFIVRDGLGFQYSDGNIATVFCRIPSSSWASVMIQIFPSGSS